MIPGKTIQTSIGKKVLMASSGLILVGFVIMHLLGNLTIFLGPDALNAYALKLRHFGALRGGARAVLLFAVIVHIVTSIQLTIENRRARPVGYRIQRTAETTLGAKTMALSGFVLLAYLVYHLLHFTFGVTHPYLAHLTDSLGRHDVYTLVVVSFQNLYLSLAYVVAMAILCLHLGHGIGSAPQTLGLNTESTIPVFQRLGRILAGLLFLGYSAIPLAVLSGFIQSAAP